MGADQRGCITALLSVGMMHAPWQEPANCFQICKLWLCVNDAWRVLHAVREEQGGGRGAVLGLQPCVVHRIKPRQHLVSSTAPQVALI